MELIALDANPATETDLASGAADEANTVGVERLVDGSSTGLSASDGNTRLAGLGLGVLLGLALLAQVLDDGSLHRELDQVERDVPDDVLDPNDTNPTT